MHITKGLIGFSLLPCLLLTAPSSAEDVEWELGDTYVGVGTGTPSAKLHVKVDDGAYGLPFIVENTNAINFSGFRLQISPTSFIDFNNAGGKFRINVDQVPGAEFEVRPNGNATLSGALTQNSDVNAKQDIVGVRHDEVLAKVVRLPISEWSYKDNPDARHIGPMAQDFYQLFALGDTDKGLSSIDTGGVALAAIQGLHAQLTEKSDLLEQVKAQNAALQTELQLYDKRMVQLETALAMLLRSRSAQVQAGTLN